jgi:hypothetical protein
MGARIREFEQIVPRNFSFLSVLLVMMNGLSSETVSFGIGQIDVHSQHVETATRTIAYFSFI